MIKVAVNSIFDADVEALVNPVNCEGVMGKGLALQFKLRWPNMFKDYAAHCKAGNMVPTVMHVWQTPPSVFETGPSYIINFPTKREWRHPSRLEDIDGGLIDLVATAKRLGIQSIAIPALGAGLGGLHWPTVRERIERAFSVIPDVLVLLYEPRS